jgi:hypothetical protein
MAFLGASKPVATLPLEDASAAEQAPVSTLTSLAL